MNQFSGWMDGWMDGQTDGETHRQMYAGLVPSQGMCKQQLLNVSLTSMFLFLSSSLPLSLKSVSVSSGDDKK